MPTGRKFQSVTGVDRKHSLANVVFDWGKEFCIYRGILYSGVTLNFPDEMRLLGFTLWVTEAETVTITLNIDHVLHELYESPGQEVAVKFVDNASPPVFIHTFGDVDTTDKVIITTTGQTFVQLTFFINEVYTEIP